MKKDRLTAVSEWLCALALVFAAIALAPLILEIVLLVGLFMLIFEGPPELDKAQDNRDGVKVGFDGNKE